MSETPTPSPSAPPPPPSTTHDLHVLADRPVEVRFDFEQRQSRVGVGASLAAHVVLALAVIAIIRYMPAREPAEVVVERAPEGLVWLAEPGPGGGGGGGGDRAPEPPRQVELPGEDKLSAPVTPPPPERPPEPPKPEVEPPVEQELTIPARTMASAQQALPGVLESANLAPDVSTSQGSGDKGGAGTGSGSGVGAGEGSGLGEGTGGGTGGGVYRPGAGITNPRVVREVKPQYTADAMRAKIQGVVLVECVVMPDGTVSDVRVIRSLDPVYGLDQEAVKAARQWRFIPGLRNGEPVPILVTIELSFNLR